MELIYGLPQPLTGSETVTIQQMQNGHAALCSMPLSQFLSLVSLTALTAGLPTSRPSASGVVWNNGGTLSIS